MSGIEVEQFWLNNPNLLFQSIQIVPNYRMNLIEQLNCITRMVLILGLLAISIDLPYSLEIIILFILFIIIIYYIQRDKMTTVEKYSYSGPSPFVKVNHSDMIRYSPKVNTEIKTTSTGQKIELSSFPQDSLPFCNDSVDLDNAFAISVNNRLATGQKVGGLGIAGNPKTKIKPIIAPRSHDLEYWRDNNLITHSNINRQTQTNMYLSGQAVSTCCGYIPKDTTNEIVQETSDTVVGGGIHPFTEMYNPQHITAPTPVDTLPQIPHLKSVENYNPQHITAPTPVDTLPQIPFSKEGYIENMQSIDNSKILAVQPNAPGWVNTTCAYNPSQVNNNLPSNLAVGNCEQDGKLSQYNKNLYTQTITPGVYTQSQVNEPINANIGISFQQQFQPTTCKRDEKGLKYTQHDPRIIQQAKKVSINYEKPHPQYDNVYDPRFYGYGTSYRSYQEPVTGQTRFFYDDVNAVRMPNYITRSKIDHLTSADTYNSYSQKGNENTPFIRALAQDGFLRDSLQFRNDLTERLMRKTNSEMWQRRKAPLGPQMM